MANLYASNITFQELNALDILPEGHEHHTMEVKRLNDVEVSVYDNRYIKLYDRNAILMSVKMPLPEEYKKIKVKAVEPIILPNLWDNLVELGQSALNNPDPEAEQFYFELPVSREHFAVLLGYFGIYPEFAPVYQKYVENPDSIVKLDNRVPEFLAQWRRDANTSESDVRLTCHILILLMVKNFNSTSIPLRDYINRYLEIRAKSVRYTLDDEQAKCLISPEGLEKMGSLWNQVPKLKEAVFKFLFRARGTWGELSAAVMLLADSSMVTIKCMTNFIETEERTTAHMERQIWREIKSFLEVASSIKAEMGPLWPYYRVIRAKDTSLSTQKFPNLARAAVLHYKKFVDSSETFARVALPKQGTIPDLDINAQTRLPETYLLSDNAAVDHNALSAEERETATMLGIDVSRWIAPKALRRQLNMDRDMPENVDMLANLLAQFQRQRV